MIEQRTVAEHGEVVTDLRAASTGPIRQEQRTLTIPFTPSNRLMYETRFRALKLIADRQVWAGAQARIDALTDEGWQVEKVRLDWGKSRPGLAHDREAWLRKLFGGVPVEETMSGIPGRGTTTVELTRSQ